MSRLRILIVDDEKTLARSIQLFFQEQGHEAEVASDADGAMERLERLRPDVVFLDLRLPGTSGLELLKRVRAHDSSVTTIVMTAYGTIEGAVEAMRLGSFDYVTKPVDLNELKLVTERAQEDRRLRQEVRYYREREARGVSAALIGRCPAIERLREEMARLAALADAPVVLLTGETGTGKSLVARALHSQGRRARGPFIEVDCTSLPTNLVETELFGYEKGSFTDARESKIGLIEAAEGGTLFLDEIGDLDLGLQGKLLRAIEERCVRRVGSVRDRKVDVWIMAATNKDLAAMQAAGSFRKDLYYRIAVVTLHLPPLREREGDVELLTEFLLKRFNAKYGKHVERLSREMLQSLQRYDWPGNLRELSHVLERALLAVAPTATELGAGALSALPPSASGGTAGGGPVSGALSLADSERAMIEQALKEAQGNQSQAARRLGISRDALRYRLAKLKTST